MRIRFLLGPAGSGKTFECLSAAREELRQRPEGDPLIFLAPKQATFQLERQLLAEDSLEGFTRLRILSFQRLARFIFEELGLPEPSVLAEEGRVMVLRALLNDCHQSLAVFQSSARRPGFAEELSRQIREFENFRFTPATLREMADQLGTERVAAKVRDLALIYEAYLDWLQAHDLRDGDALLTRAAKAAESAPGGTLRIAGLWFDGFAQLTPQERRLLVAILARCEAATLAFCLDSSAASGNPLSHWNLVEGTFNKCAGEITGRFGRGAVETIHLRRDPARGRFAASPPLAFLEANWTSAAAAPFSADQPAPAIEIAECPDPEAEAIFCAREILCHVRAGGRYREAAVLFRSLDNGCPEAFRRVFTRYGIPAFFDQRESVAHHPMAELTRGALRALAFNWRHEDWFGALKSGLAQTHEEELDDLENEALARGWEGKAWENGFKIRGNPALESEFNRLRQRLILPMLELARNLGRAPDGTRLAEALRKFWETLSVREQLEKWTAAEGQPIHQTVWEQMTQWIGNIAQAFPEQPLSLREWLPILEAGLASLTAGQIPPSLDQVLIGAIDRSRNPDLKIVFAAGMNEGIFPAAAARDCLLTQRDRERLAVLGRELASIPGQQLAAEQFYGYIACTRARERLVLTCSKTGPNGKVLNPSRFISQLRRIFPELKPRQWTPPDSIIECVHPSELLPHLARDPRLRAAFGTYLPGPLLDLEQRLAGFRAPDAEEALSPDSARKLYGPELCASVSALEKFAACPFQFFVSRGLKLQERQMFEFDVREEGDFKHKILERFHNGVIRDGFKWRDLSPADARARIRRAAEELLPEFRDGLLHLDEQNRFIAEGHVRALEEFIEVVIGWFEHNAFDPVHVELPFGTRPDDPLPGWRIELDERTALLLRGRIDRVDFFHDGGRAWCIIMDYKSTRKTLDRTLLWNGIQQQLPAYLLTLTREETRRFFGVEELAGAGIFFLPLKPGQTNGRHRGEVLASDPDAARRKAFTHRGIFDADLLGELDSEWDGDKSHQFAYQVTKKGVPYKNRFQALPAEQFEAVLDRSEQLLREIGRRIYQGEVRAHPYTHRRRTACNHCEFQSICRFDPWVHPYRTLETPPEQP